MRTSRVVFAGIAVAAAAATTSAFTGSNAGMGKTDIAGYGENTASGTTVSNVAYTPVTGDNSKLDYVTFTVGTDVTNEHPSMTLKEGSTALGSYTCPDMGTFDSMSKSMTVKCVATDQPRIDTFDTVGLTVHQ